MENIAVGINSEFRYNTIHDSGNRTKFDTGAVRDMHEGKGRMDLLPWKAIIEVSKLCEIGAKKYGEHNVDKGIPMYSFLDSGSRHLGKFMAGESDENHLLAAAWNLLWAIEVALRSPELCGIPNTDESYLKGFVPINIKSICDNQLSQRIVGKDN